MDRMEEYKALRDAPEELPPALDGAVARARARARRRRLWRRVSAPAGSVAAVFAAFVLLVNLSTPFALACGKVPVLKELAAAVAFSPSLKAAVEHDFIQYIGQSQTDNGITLHLEYLFPDRGQLQFYATVTGPEEFSSFMVHPVLTDESGQPLETYGSTSKSVHPGELSNAFTVFPFGDAAFPETLYLTCEISGHRGGATEPPEPLEGDPSAPYAVVSFRLPLDKENAAREATGQPTKPTKFETDKAKLRRTIRQALSQAGSFDEFASLLLREGVTVKESRGRLSYLTPDRTKPITARKLGDDFDKAAVLALLTQNAHRAAEKPKAIPEYPHTQKGRLQEEKTAKTAPADNTLQRTFLPGGTGRSLFCRLCRHAGKPYRAEAGGKDAEQEKGAATAGTCLFQDPPCPGRAETAEKRQRDLETTSQRGTYALR